MPVRRILALLLVTSLATAQDGVTMAQTPPSASDAARYTGLLAAASEGDADEVRHLIAAGSDLEITDDWAARRFMWRPSARMKRSSRSLLMPGPT